MEIPYCHSSTEVQKFKDIHLKIYVPPSGYFNPSILYEMLKGPFSPKFVISTDLSFFCSVI